MCLGILSDVTVLTFNRWTWSPLDRICRLGGLGTVVQRMWHVRDCFSLDAHGWGTRVRVLFILLLLLDLVDDCSCDGDTKVMLEIVADICVYVKRLLL